MNYSHCCLLLFFRLYFLKNQKKNREKQTSKKFRFIFSVQKFNSANLLNSARVIFSVQFGFPQCL